MGSQESEQYPLRERKLSEIEIRPILLEELRADHRGKTVKDWGVLSSVVFGEPPWNDTYEIPRLVFGIGVDLMRENAKAFEARTSSGRHVGHTLGYEVFRISQGDPRRVSLREISGAGEMDNLFNNGRLFYVDTLVVHPGFRRMGQIEKEIGVGEELTKALIESVRLEEFAGVVLRTHLKAIAARGLYAKLGFKELRVHDMEEENRDFWFLSLK
ncbi:MAG: GNAT family N-acetyltransferase [Patescibacteria group bacterium]